MIANHQADLVISFPPVMFAQDSPPLGRQGTGTIAGDGAAGGDPAAGQAEPGGGDFLLFMFLPLILVMILFSVFGQRKERKKREALLSSVKKHDRIRTIGGVIGSVVELDTETVVLKVDESSNTRMTFARDAVQQVLESE
ncbi:MAG: preprotein translocase subunit YajC [Planctomycetaceae bacterium]|nr:preprotein translocase subunit YajC [Planctomycetaceae bacterium]